MHCYWRYRKPFYGRGLHAAVMAPALQLLTPCVSRLNQPITGSSISISRNNSSQMNSWNVSFRNAGLAAARVVLTDLDPCLTPSATSWDAPPLADMPIVLELTPASAVQAW